MKPSLREVKPSEFTSESVLRMRSEQKHAGPLEGEKGQDRTRRKQLRIVSFGTPGEAVAHTTTPDDEEQCAHF